MSLKSLAEQRLAHLRGDETPPETAVKQVKQEGASVFHGEAPCFTPMKHDFPQKSAENEPCFTVTRPIGVNDETGALPADVLAGLDRLRHETAPRITRPRVWGEVVADALRLASGGWAVTALGLGWEPVQLWGCSPDRGGNSDHDGLAVTLRGRRIVMLDERRVFIDGGNGDRVLFKRRPMPGAVLLWEIISGR